MPSVCPTPTRLLALLSSVTSPSGSRTASAPLPRTRHRVRRWRVVARALLLRVATAALPSVSAAQTQRTRDTTRQTDQRANRTGPKGSTTGATLPTGSLPPIITPVLCTLSGAPPTLLASAPSCRPCSADYTEGPATLWARAPTCTACPRPGIGRYWSGGAMCTPKTLMATLSARARLLVVTADPAGSTAPLGAYPITTWTYTFGDGSPNVTVGNSTPPTHTYATAGTYTITLTVSNTMGDAPGSATQSVTVSVPPCVAGAPQSQTVACPLGQSGLIIQERLPDTGAAGPGACPFLPWTTTSNTCVPDVTITGSLTGTGTGALTITPARLTVTKARAAAASTRTTAPSGTLQTVTITATGGGTIASVSGCTGATTGGSSTTCTVSPTANTTVSATVNASTVTVRGSLSGTGTGSIARAVTLTKPGAGAVTGVIATGPAGTPFTVTITATGGGTIASVSGCTGATTGGSSTTCTVSPLANTTVSAVLNTPVIGPYQLSLFANGVAAASGRVSTPLISAVKTAGGANAIGMDLYSGGETFLITIQATGGSTIASVTGCTATGTRTLQTCSRTMSTDRMVLAVFNPPVTTAPLTLEVQGVAATAGSATNGTMTATKTSMGANASNTESVTSGTSQTITITANAGSTIQSVAGCRARGTATSQSCTFTMPTIPRTITAILAPAAPPDVWVTITSTAPPGTSGRALYMPAGWQVDNLGVTGQINAIPVPQGRTQTITLTGFSGATLSRITGCTGAVIGASSTRCTITPMANTAMTIVWGAAPPTTSLTLTTTVPVGGYTGSVSINPLGSGMMNPGVTNDNLLLTGVPVGSTQTLTISSTGGATLQSITNCLGAVIGSTSTRCTVNFPGPQTVQIVWGTAPPPPTVTLTLNANGSGTASGSLSNGSITATRPSGGPNGTNSQTVASGSVQTITITATGGSTIASVTGCAASGSATSQTCSFSIFSNTTITATFTAPAVNPTLTLQANGVLAADAGSVRNGSITATKFSMGANGANSQVVANGSFQFITITASGGSTIQSVTGCAASGSTTSQSCSFNIVSNTTITATFQTPAANPILSLQATGTGAASGSVTNGGFTATRPNGGPNGFNSQVVPNGSFQNITITASGGSTITSVTGCAATGSATSRSCSISVFANTTIRADFAPPPAAGVTITAITAGSGVGTVALPTASPSITLNHPGFGNPSQSGSVTSGSTHTVSIRANAGSTIRSVTGCAGATLGGTFTTCFLTPFRTTTINVRFARAPPPTVTLTLNANGSGTASGSLSNGSITATRPSGGPNGTNSQTVASGSFQTIRITATGGSTIARVTGCAASGSTTNQRCSFTISTSTTITATFTPPLPPPPTTYTVTLQAQGTGAGTVTNRFNSTQTSKTQGGPNTSTTLTVTEGTTVTFTAARNGLSTVTGLSGASCFASGGRTMMNCSVTVNSNLTITGTFTAPVLNLYAVLTTSTSSVQAGDTYTARLCSSSIDAGAAPITNYQITRNGVTVWNRASCGPVSITPAAAGIDVLVGTISNGGVQPNSSDTENVTVLAAPLCTLIGVPGGTLASSAVCEPCPQNNAYWIGNPQCNTRATSFNFFPAGGTVSPPGTAGSLGLTCAASSGFSGPTVTVTCTGSLNYNHWGNPNATSALYARVTMSGATFVGGTNTLTTGRCSTSMSWSCSSTSAVPYSLFSGSDPSMFARYGNLSGFFPQPFTRANFTMTFSVPNVAGTSGTARMPWTANGVFPTRGTALWTWTLIKTWF